MRKATTLIIFLGLTSCTGLFLQPTRERYRIVESDRLVYSEMKFASSDGTQLNAWYFPAVANQKARPEYILEAVEKPKGLVVQYHGNAQNIGTHYRGVVFFNFAGYDLLTFDYRGYGESEGAASVKGAYLDARAMLRIAEKQAQERQLPLILYGQSLGGSLLLRALEDEPPPAGLRLVVIESSFFSYKMIAREKLADFWLTWPLQWMSYLLVTDRYAPGGEQLERLPKEIPIVLLYSQFDPVVPIQHGEKFAAAIRQPREFWRHPFPGHINGMFVNDGRYRKDLLALMETAIAR